MPVTSVNRLARNIENAQKLVENLNTEIRRKYFSRHSASMTENGRKLVKQREDAIQKITNMNSKLKSMNQGVLQVQLRKIENKRENIRKNLNKIMEGYGNGKNELIQKVFREYSHWYLNDPKKQANKIRNLEAQIERLPTATNYNRRKKAVAKLAIQQAKIGINERALKNAVNLRKKHISREKPARNKLRSIVKQRVLQNNIKLGPSGTLTLEPRRRFPGFKEPTLEEYAREKRKVDRLERERNRLQGELENLRRSIKRKRNNNNRN